MLKLINIFYENKDAQNTRRGLYDFIRGCKEKEDDDGNEETNEQLRADFPILSEHGIMPVTDVNENFSSPINGDNEQDGFNGEPIQQPSTTINTDRYWPWNTWLDPDGNPAYYWMGVVTLAALYNLSIIIIRLTFSDMAANWSFLFILFDALSDIIYLIDIFVQFRMAYYDDGCLETDPKKLAMNYRRQNRFLADVISTIPLQYVVNFCIGLLRCLFIRIEFFDFSSIYITMLRLPRLVKTFIIVRFFEVTDSRTSTPNRIRAIKLSLYLWLVIHWIGCVYYILSEYEGRGSNEWVYPSGEEFDPFSRKYIRCLYWSMLILTTIGERPSPCTDLEYVFTGMTFVIGVFVFAAVVGNVGDVISNMNASRQDFQARMDQIKFYMHHRNVPESLQNRIKRWAEYSWTRTQAIDEPHLLQLLPERLRTEIAIQVHLETLKKVKLFEECEEGLLRELVLKLKPQTFSPNDYICRIGEVGREMFIINHGQVEILVPSSENGAKIVVSRLVRGNYFGEISLLKLDDGHNRRTADVRSVGYSELLCLSNRDLFSALAEYPEAKRILEKSAEERIIVNKALSKFKEKLQQEPMRSERKDKPRNKKDLSDVVSTPEFKTLVTRQASEMDDLRKVVADLKELGYKISKLQAEKDRDRIIKSLKRKVRESERDLHEAYTRIGYLESILELRQPAKTPCPCEGEFCVSPLHQNSNSQFTRMNTSSLEILSTRDNNNSADRSRPFSSHFPTGIRTLPVNYKVPRTRELPSLSLFTLKPQRSASESSQQNGAISAENSKDLSESAKTSNGYSSDTETTDTNTCQSSRRQIPNISRMESYSSDLSENIPLCGSDDDIDSFSDNSEVTDDDVLLSPAHEREFFTDVAPNPAFAKSNGLTVLNQGEKRKSFTVEIKQTFV